MNSTNATQKITVSRGSSISFLTFAALTAALGSGCLNEIRDDGDAEPIGDTGSDGGTSDADLDAGSPDTDPDTTGICDGPNPAGCRSTGCPDGQMCITDPDVSCTPSSCFCDPEYGWGCTDDCNGGVCVEQTECRADDECPVGALCVDGMCTTDVGCPTIYAPVCGVDNNTYGNACEAGVAHVEVAYEGECELSSDCRSDEECAYGSAVCEANMCEPCPDMTVVDCAACPEGYESLIRNGCMMGCECVPSAECTSDADCADGQFCQPGDFCFDWCEAGDPACCSGNVCVDATPACEGENPAGCNAVGCPFGFECVASDDASCHPSACVCDEETGGWLCTADCGPGSICMPTNSCESDIECEIGQICEGMCLDAACTREYAPVCGADNTTYSNACMARSAHVPVAYEGECTGEPIACMADTDCAIWSLCVDGVCEATACPDIYMPVCGTDGRTYGNSCEARASHVEVAHDGACEELGCRDSSDCARGEVCYPPTDTCQPVCEIDCFRYEPVCGFDGVTYGCGQADAWCHGTEVAYEGECGSEGRACNVNTDCPVFELCVGSLCSAVACPAVYMPVCGEDGRTYGNACEAAAAHVAVAYEGECAGM